MEQVQNSDARPGSLAVNRAMQQKILVSDDDPHIRDVVCFALEQAGFATSQARNGAECLAVFAQNGADLVVLDIGMPEIDGLDVCRALRRKSEVPVLFLTARDEEIDRIVGFEIGGDDYVTKPFSPRELVGRVKAILKRAGGSAAEPEASRWGGLEIFRDTHVARLGQTVLPLTALEFEIMRTMVARPANVHSRASIMLAAYGGKIHVSDRTIDSHIRNIRAKLADAGAPDMIETVHGVGFRLKAGL
jgi:two-component system OmpR family response regulator